MSPVVKLIQSKAHVLPHISHSTFVSKREGSRERQLTAGDCFTFSGGLKAVVDIYPLDVVCECGVWQ